VLALSPVSYLAIRENVTENNGGSHLAPTHIYLGESRLREAIGVTLAALFANADAHILSVYRPSPSPTPARP
jgi:hypothetical protein